MTAQILAMPLKKAKAIRSGDMIRTTWKVPGRVKALCLTCRDEWAPPGITMLNVCRNARKHSRNTGHVTRVAYTEIVEYRPPVGKTSRASEA